MFRILNYFVFALVQAGSSCKVISVQFAKDAMKYLCREGHYADEKQFPRPTLIVLDLSLPGMTGIEFLTWAKGEPLATLPPIVVLSYSQLELNRHLALKLGAKGYFLKSPDMQESVAITKSLLLFNAPPSELGIRP